MPRLLAIDWNETEARLAVGALRGEQIVVEHAFSVTLRAPENREHPAADVASQIAAALSARGIGRLETLVSIGRASIELRQLTVPPAPEEELPDLVRFQALREFTGLQEDWPLDYVPLDGGEGQPRRVLAAAIDSELVTHIRETCQQAGLKLRRLLLRPCAAASLLRRRTDETSQVRLLVDLLGDEADLTVLVDRNVVFLRTARLPGDPLALGEPAQAIVGEIRRTVAAAQNQLGNRRVETIVLCGSGPQHTLLADSIGQQLSTRVELFDPFAGLRLEGDLRRGLPEHPGRFTPLLGMLWDELTGTPHAFDFLHPRRRPEPPSRRRLYLRAALGALAVVLLAAGYVGAEFHALDAELLRLEKESQQWDTRLSGSGKIEQTVAELDKWLAGETIWLEELRWLSQTMPPATEAMLTQLQCASGPKGGELSLEGLARSVETITAMEQKLCDKTRHVVGKDKGEDTSRKPYICLLYTSPSPRDS